MRNITKNVLSVLGILIFSVVVISGGIYAYNRVSANETQKAMFLEKISNKKVITLVVYTEREIQEKINYMEDNLYYLEFIVFKYNEDGIKEAFLGFWPFSDIEKKNEIAKQSIGLIWNYMMQENTGENDFSIKFNPNLHF